MAKRRRFDPKRFFRKVEEWVNEQPLKEEDLSTFKPLMEKLFSILNPFFDIRNLYLYRKEEANFILKHRLVKESMDNIRDSFPEADINRIDNKLRVSKNRKALKTLSVVNNRQLSLIFVVFGSDNQLLFLVKANNQTYYFDQLYYLLSSFNYFLNQHVKFSTLESNIYKASEIQNSILPEKIPQFSDFEISAYFIPTEIVGGDVYDFNPLDDDLLGVTIADASGHGLPAALQARDVIIGLRVGIEKENKIWSVIQKLNKVIYETSISNRFISLFYGEIEKDGLLTYVNAGHCNPIYVDKDKTELLDIGGVVLGWTGDTTFSRGFKYLENGSALVLYTDGLTETQLEDGEEYGTDRLTALIQANYQKSSQQILDIIMQDIRKAKKNPEWEDDVSLIVIKRKPDPDDK